MRMSSPFVPSIGSDKPRLPLVVRAEAHSDDHHHELAFDASVYLADADDAVILALAMGGWANQEADRLVQHKWPGYPDALGRLRDYAYDTDDMGFEVVVSRSDAMAFLSGTRPALWEQIRNMELSPMTWRRAPSIAFTPPRYVPLINAVAVHELCRACLFAEGEAADVFMPGDGVHRSLGFHPERLLGAERQIREWLDALPEKFHLDVKIGGGWSFINGTVDRNGERWGELGHLDELLVMGNAINYARTIGDPVTWPSRPMGVPFFCIGDAPKVPFYEP